MPESVRFDLAGADSALVIKPSSLGDVIHTLPAISCLRAACPDLAIDWVVNTEWAPLLEGHPALRRVIPMPRREWRGWRDLPKARRWARETLGQLQPDLVLDFQGLLRSALLSKASGGKHRVGFRRAREGASLLYDQKVEVEDWKGTHAVDRYLALVEAIGVETGLAEHSTDPPIDLFPLPEGTPVELSSPVLESSFVLLHPFSRGRGKSMNFSEVAEFCREFGKLRSDPILLVGAGFSWPEPGSGPEKPDNLVDLLDQTSLSQLIWLMRRAGFIVSVDSGPMHLAAALTDKLISLHTWTNPLMVGPWRKEAWVWREGSIQQVKEIDPDQFPENRDSRDQFSDGILPSGQAASLARFIAGRVSDDSDPSRG